MGFGVKKDTKTATEVHKSTNLRLIYLASYKLQLIEPLSTFHSTDDDPHSTTIQ